ncbi:MAG TPA: hypothetical protein VJV75_13350 [Candidatus Polarisedimenticolia bacterium]|nr:hypothetical protein [Candidatus Polarisedimenticolia bacterium]
MPLLELLPDGIGDFSEWVAVPSGSPAGNVLDLQGPDGDATYIRSTGNIDAAVLSLFTFQRRPRLAMPIRSVAWVGVKPWAKRQSVGAQFLAGTIKSGAVRADFPSVQVTAPVYVALDWPVTGWRAFTDPATGNGWTVDAALAAQAGIVDTTPNTTHEMRVTKLVKQVWVEFASRGHAAVRYDTRL